MKANDKAIRTKSTKPHEGKAVPEIVEIPGLAEIVAHNREEIERLTRELAERAMKPRGLFGIRTSV